MLSLISRQLKPQQPPQPPSNRDIEAALHTLPPQANRSLNGQNHQQDGDPFHRRTNAGTTAAPQQPPQLPQVTQSIDMEAIPPTVPTDSLSCSLGSSIRSGNYTVNDLEIISASRPRNGTTLPISKPSSATQEPRLLHPLLLRVPLHMRFGMNGLLCNILFMVVYNYAVVMFEQYTAVSTIYSIVYLVFIPLGHALVSLLVFGWPERYGASLLHNSPIGLTALVIGGFLTSYLDTVHFSNRVDDFVRDYFTFSKMPARLTADGMGEESQFWSSLLVMFVTSLWTYVLSIYINSIPTKSEKKEL